MKPRTITNDQLTELVASKQAVAIGGKWYVLVELAAEEPEPEAVKKMPEPAADDKAKLHEQRKA